MKGDVPFRHPGPSAQTRPLRADEGRAGPRLRPRAAWLQDLQQDPAVDPWLWLPHPLPTPRVRRGEVSVGLEILGDCRLPRGPLQMVVLMDPMEDPDDILRAHRSREKSYLFDVAFDFTATQVTEGLGQGHLGLETTFAPVRREPSGDLPLTLSLPSPIRCLAFTLLCPHAHKCARACMAHTQRPTWTHPGQCADPTLHRYPHSTLCSWPLWGRCLKPIWCGEERLGEADTLPGTPILPICRMIPGADVMRPRGGGQEPAVEGGISGVLSSLSGWHPPMG